MRPAKVGEHMLPLRNRAQQHCHPSLLGVTGLMLCDYLCHECSASILLLNINKPIFPPGTLQKKQQLPPSVLSGLIWTQMLATQ